MLGYRYYYCNWRFPRRYISLAGLLRSTSVYLLLTLYFSRCNNLRLGTRYVTHCIHVERTDER